MKQIIVMVSMVLLGIAIAAFVGQFKDTAANITEVTNNEIESQLTSSSGINF